MPQNFKDKKFISYALFEDALANLALGELNNSAVSRLIGADHATMAQCLRGHHKWQADTWIYYMLAIGAMSYEDGLLSMALEVPTPYLKRKLERIAEAERTQIFCARKLSKSPRFDEIKRQALPRGKQNPKQSASGLEEGDVQLQFDRPTDDTR